MAELPAEGLLALQRWLFSAVSHREGVDAGVERASRSEDPDSPGLALQQVIPANDRLSAVEQLDIYAHMYFARMVEVIEAEYVGVRQLLGPRTFQILALDYLESCPSRHYSLNRLSADLPRYLEARSTELSQTSGQARLLRFAADLARVERTMEEVVDDPLPLPLAPALLEALSPDDWSTTRLETSPAMRLLALDHPVAGFFETLNEDEGPSVPESAPSWVCIYQGTDDIWRLDLCFEQYLLLSALVAGNSLGEAIETTASNPRADTGIMLTQVGEWFREWSGSGLFVGLTHLEEGPGGASEPS